MHAFEATPLFLMSYLLYTCVALNRLCNEVEFFARKGVFLWVRVLCVKVPSHGVHSF